MANITKRGNSYRIRVYINGSSKSFTWTPEAGLSERKIQKDLFRIADDFERKCRSGFNGSMLFSDFSLEYFNWIKSRVAPSTYASYINIYDLHLSPAFGRCRLSSITRLQVQNAINLWSKTHKSNTVKRFYSVLSCILARAVKLAILDLNPASSDFIEFPFLADEKDVQCYTLQEVNNFLNCLDDYSITWQTLFYFAFSTGCRRGEISALKWSDIDFSTSSVYIQRSAYKLIGQPIEFKQPKSKSGFRTISLPAFLIPMLKNLKISQPFDTDFVFSMPDGSCMYPAKLSTMFNYIQKKQGFRRISFHGIRHTSATLLLDSGSSIKTVSSRLGHSRINVTERYLHAVSSSDVKASETFDHILTKKI